MTLNPHLTHLQTSGLIQLAQDYPELEYLFRHALVQDAAYNSLLISDRQQLHQIVGETLEQLYPDKLTKLAASLGQHFMNAGELDKAVHYLRLAGDNAKQAYANQEAIQYYQQAVTILNGQIDVDPQVHQKLLFYLHECLGDIWNFTRQIDAARNAYQLALGHASETDSIGHARLQRKLGQVLPEIEYFQEKFQAYDVAETLLGPTPIEPIETWWQEWLQIQISRGESYYFLGQINETLDLAEQIRPILAQYGSSKQRRDFSAMLRRMIMRRNRYANLDDALGYALIELDAANESSDRVDIAEQHFSIGFLQLWRGALDEAEKHLHFAMETAEQTGGSSLTLRSLTYLCVLHRRRGQIAEMPNWCCWALSLAINNSHPNYIAMAHANQAWLAWREQKWSEVKQNGQLALDIWEHIYPFQWAALWPLLDVVLREQDVATAVSYAQQLLHPSQQKLPDPITTSLEKAIASWQTADLQTTTTHLQQAIKTTKQMGFF